MNLIAKLQPVIIIGSAILGLVLGSLTSLGEVSHLLRWNDR